MLFLVADGGNNTDDNEGDDRDDYLQDDNYEKRPKLCEATRISGLKAGRNLS